jgi:phospholipase/lecithinase/hemolysin
MGARKFVVSDVGPLGCIPYVRALKFMPAGECSASANRVTVGYNKKLKTMVGKMNREMGPDSKVVYTNTYDIVTEIIQRYRQYGTLLFALAAAVVSCKRSASEHRMEYLLLFSEHSQKSRLQPKHVSLPGFDNALDPCCGGSFPPFLCIGIGNSSLSSLCEDRSKYVFWDAFHPTEATNIIVAGKLLDGDAAAASPINIRQLYQYRFE